MKPNLHYRARLQAERKAAHCWTSSPRRICDNQWHPRGAHRCAFAILLIGVALASSIVSSFSLAANSTSSPSAESTATKSVTAEPRNPRVLFITAKDSPQSATELARLSRKGGDFDHMRARGWKIGKTPDNQVQIVDRDEIPDLIEKLQVHDFPTVACIDDGEVVRSFRWGCTTPLDSWTIGFLATGIDHRPAGAVLESARVATTGAYPLRGNHWSVDGDWSPTRDTVLSHLHGPNHQSQLEPQWQLESWSYEELRSVHDDLHEKYDSGTYSNSRKQRVENYQQVKGRG